MKDIIEELLFKGWVKIGCVLFLFLIMITSSHCVDEKVMELYRKNEEIKKLKAIYVDTGIKLMNVKSQNYIKKKVNGYGLKQFNQSPVQIKIINE